MCLDYLMMMSQLEWLLYRMIAFSDP